MIPVLVTNPRSGTHYLKALLAASLGPPPIEREYAAVRDLKAALAEARENQVIYGHLPFREFGRVLESNDQHDIGLILLTRHPIDRLISQLAFERAQGGRLPDPARSPQQLARELLLGEWDGRPWADGTLVADYAEVHNFYLRQLHTDWLAAPGCAVVRYENLVADPRAVLAGIFGALRIPVPTWRIWRATRQVTFKSLAGGRKPGQVDATSHYRKGLPGEWRQVFSTADIERLRPRYAAVFAEAGYPL